MRIAVIGSGIAGLTAAYRLSQQNAGQVVLIERHARLGMDAHRIEMDVDDQRVVADVPSRMFSEAQWPTLKRLYDEIGVESVPVDPTQSFSMLRNRGDSSSGRCYLQMKVATDSRLPWRSKLTARNYIIARDARRLQVEGMIELERKGLSTETIGSYLDRNSYSSDFVYRFLYPILSSTICTCRYRYLQQYPAEVLLGALANLVHRRSLLRTKYGTGDVTNRLSQGIDEICTETSVKSVHRSGGRVHVVFGHGEERSFDHVIFATQANAVCRLLADCTSDERKILTSIKYDDVRVSIHRDADLMPHRQSKWSTFNFMTDHQHKEAACTVWLNRFHHDWKIQSPVFQTIGSLVFPQPNKLIRQYRMRRAVVERGALIALDQLTDLHRQPDRRVWFCGSWAGHGVPLLESGTASAEAIATHVTNRLAKVRLQTS